MSHVVMIDPGHGGKDPGAVAADGTRESNMALRVANALFRELAGRGFKPSRTREKDVFVELTDRAKLANAAGAACFVSIHFNAALNVKAKGALVLHADRSTRGKELARSIYRAIEDAPDAPDRVYPDVPPYTRHKRIAVLRQTKMPAVLVECGFLTNPAELAEMQQPGWPQKTAERIADGIDAWFKGGPSDQAT